jgi:pteridine reductase
MQKNADRQVALITGAGRRIGAVIARALHEQGCDVVLHCNISRDEAHLLANELNSLRAASALVLQANLLEVAACQNLITQTIRHWGRLDILINNAARFYRTKTGETTEAAWDDLVNSNLRAPFFLAQAAANYLAERQGCIVNIADVHGERPMRDYSVYCISKAGVLMLTQSLAKELAPKVRVNAVSPGPTVLPEGSNEMTPEIKEKILSRTAMRRMGNAAEIAKAVLYFVNSDYVTGQELAVDGGRSLTI